MNDRISRRDFLKITGTSIIGTSLSGSIFTKVFARTGEIRFGPKRFAIIADLHLDVKGTNGMKMSAESVDCLKQTVDDLNTEDDLAFVLVLGDLLQDGEWENASVVKKYIEKLNMPSYVICGNHDFIPTDRSKLRKEFTYMTIDEFVSYFKDFGYGSAGKRYYARQVIPGLRVIGLDACLPDDPRKWGGILPGEQIKWLDDQLSDYADQINIVFIHHNLIRWSAGEQPGNKMANFCIDNEIEVRKLLSKHASAVPVVFSGHRHIGLRYYEENGIAYFVTPSINSYPMRYSVFSISNHSITWKTPMVSVNERVHIEARENLLKAEWWRGDQFKKRNPENDAAVLDFYEGSDKIIGKKNFEGKAYE